MNGNYSTSPEEASATARPDREYENRLSPMTSGRYQ